MQQDRESTSLPRPSRRVAEAAATRGLAIEIVLLEQSSRTAQEAADACGARVGQIVKSLVFRTVGDAKPLLLLVSGDNRVDEKAVAGAIGDAIERPDADFVRAVTGFAIGGIPPFGHAQALECWIDEDLLGHQTVWAAAGTPNSVFAADPKALARASGATAIRVTSG